MNLLEYLYEHKIKGCLLSIGGLATGKGLGEVDVYQLHIPPVVIETFQTLAYAGGAIVSFLTISAIVIKKVKAWWNKKQQ